jgi:hypothetical protein
MQNIGYPSPGTLLLTLLVAPGLTHPMASTSYPLAYVRSLSVFDI